jgi:chloramphenicol-sensitive protein RarD
LAKIPKTAYRTVPARLECIGYNFALAYDACHGYFRGMTQKITPQKNEDSLAGFAFALSAYVLWGFLPLYMKALAHIPPIEVIAHRVLWSLPIAAIVLLAQGRTADLKRALRTPSMLGMAAVAAALISINWGVYIWAIGAGHALDAALGYYINPLFSIFLGSVLLKEQLGKLQKYAVALAALAVVVLTVGAGQLPVIALALTFSWGLYAYLKKQLPIGPNQGFTLEVLLLTPFALGYLIYAQASGISNFFQGNTHDTVLLLGCGVVTAVPLMLYANGAKLLRLSTIGIMQYVAPTMIFLTAVFVFGEPFGIPRMVAFPMIWGALVLYSIAMFRGRTRKPKAG